MIARILSGGPIFVPRKAREDLTWSRRFWRGVYFDYVWIMRRGLQTSRPQPRFVPFPPSSRTQDGFVLRRSADVIPFQKVHA